MHNSRSEFRIGLLPQLRAKVESLEREDHETLAKAAKIFELAARAPELWKSATSTDRRRELLELVGSNYSWDGETLTVEFAQPFDSLVLLADNGASAGPALVGLAEGGSLLVSQQGIEPRRAGLETCVLRTHV